MSDFGGTIFTNPLVPSGGGFERSNVDKLSKTSGKLRFECTVCNLTFERYACWVFRPNRRIQNVCCGVACMAEQKRRPIKMQCVECGVEFIEIPSNVGRIVTCSAKCRSARRKELTRTGEVLGSHVSHPKRGEGNKPSKLTVEQVAEIIASKESGSVTAKKYGVSACLINKLRRAARQE